MLATPASPNIHTSRMPAMKNSALHTSTISMVWPKSGCTTSSATTISSIASEMALVGMSAACGFAEQPGHQNDESGFEKFRGLNVDAEQDQPAPRALDSTPKKGVAATMMTLMTNT